MERTVSHIGAVLKATPHADEASLTSQTKPIENIFSFTPTLSEIYIGPYPQKIKYMSYLNKDHLRA